MLPQGELTYGEEWITAGDRVVQDDVLKGRWWRVQGRGHSDMFWLLSFFRTYLPYKVDHIAKWKNIVNGGVVKFTLTKVGAEGAGEDRFFIDPASVQVIYAIF